MPSFEIPAIFFTCLSVFDSPKGSSNTFKTRKNISLYFKRRHLIIYKTSHLKYESFVRASYLKKLDPNIAKVIFKARTRMFDIQVNYKRKYKFTLDCPFPKYYETFDHIFKCNSGLFQSRCLHATK